MHGKAEGIIRKYSGGVTFDISGSSTASNIKSGMLVTFARSYEYDSVGRTIRATALDNRIGCACLLEIMRSIVQTWNKDIRIVFAFTAGEEKNNSILDRIALKYRAGFGIVVDAAYAVPVPFDVENMVIPKLGNGCAVQYIGNGFIVRKSILETIKKEALIRKIPFQLEIPSPDIGRTNFPKLHRAGIPGCVLNIPVRYQHCQISEADMNDVDSASCMIKMVIELFEKNKGINFFN